MATGIYLPQTYPAATIPPIGPFADKTDVSQANANAWMDRFFECPPLFNLWSARFAIETDTYTSAEFLAGKNERISTLNPKQEQPDRAPFRRQLCRGRRTGRLLKTRWFDGGGLLVW